MDERVADAFDPAAGDVERLMDGCSVLHCLPVGMEGQPSAGTGTVMHTSAIREYAITAGFQDVEVLPLEHPSFNFYRLVGSARTPRRSGSRRFDIYSDTSGARVATS
jgi:hypothetical protein